MNILANKSEDSPYHWMYYVELSLGIISVIGSLFIIFVFFFYKKLRSFPFELVVYLTIASSISTLSYIIHYVDEENSIVFDMFRCKLQAFLMIWFEISQMIWVNLITYYLYQNFVHFGQDDDTSEEENITLGRRFKYLFTGFVLPVILPLIGLEFDLLGPSGRWCWICADSKSSFTSYYAFIVYFILWGLIIVNLVFTFVIIKHLNRIEDLPSEKRKIRKIICKLIRYPIIQIICALPATINRIIFTFTGNFSLVVQFLCLVVSGSQGFAFAVAYGYNPQVRAALCDSLTSWCCCCKKKKKKKVEVKNPDLKNSFISFNSSIDSFFKHDFEDLNGFNASYD